VREAAVNDSLVDLLKVDHRKLENLYTQLRKERGSENVDEANCENLFFQLRAMVISHSKAEEMALYSLFSDADEKEEKDLKRNALEGYEEHQLVDRLLSDMEDTEVDDDQWQAKLTVMTELLDHHIKEEEREFFPEVKKVLEQEELEDLGALYLQQQREIYKIEMTDGPATFYEGSIFQF
jgi:hemerythrin superfamily protein